MFDGDELASASLTGFVYDTKASTCALLVAHFVWSQANVLPSSSCISYARDGSSRSMTEAGR